MITERQLLNLGFKKQSRASYQPGFQSHGDVFIKNELAIDGYYSSGYDENFHKIDQFTCSDLSGQKNFKTLKELDTYFMVMGKPSIFKL